GSALFTVTASAISRATRCCNCPTRSKSRRVATHFAASACANSRSAASRPNRPQERRCPHDRTLLAHHHAGTGRPRVDACLSADLHPRLSSGRRVLARLRHGGGGL